MRMGLRMLDSRSRGRWSNVNAITERSRNGLIVWKGVGDTWRASMKLGWAGPSKPARLGGRAGGWLLLRRLGVACVLVSLAWPCAVAPALAQSGRIAYLTRLLATSDTFRVRAQAAVSLGRVEPNVAIVSALMEALQDPHPAVRTAAASSLERLADPSALPALERARRDRDRSVRRAVVRAIRVLERVARRQRARPEDSRSGAGTAEFYVGVGVPGNQAGVDSATLQRARAFIEGQLRAMNGVQVAPESETNAQARRVLRRAGLTGYYVDASIVSVEENASGTRAVVSVILNTYPGRDMRAILQGAATVPGARGEQAARQAVEGALRGALRRLPQAMRVSRR